MSAFSPQKVVRLLPRFPALCTHDSTIQSVAISGTMIARPERTHTGSRTFRAASPSQSEWRWECFESNLVAPRHSRNHPTILTFVPGVARFVRKVPRVAQEGKTVVSATV